MVQGCDCARFPDKAFATRFIRRQAVSHHLNRHHSVQPRVPRPVHLAHATGPDARLYNVGAEWRTKREERGVIGSHHARSGIHDSRAFEKSRTDFTLCRKKFVQLGAQRRIAAAPAFQERGAVCLVDLHGRVENIASSLPAFRSQHHASPSRLISR
jgi:hypothetical protein